MQALYEIIMQTSTAILHRYFDNTSNSIENTEVNRTNPNLSEGNTNNLIDNQEEANSTLAKNNFFTIPNEIKDEILNHAGRSDYRAFHSTCHFFYNTKADVLHNEYLNKYKIVTSEDSYFFFKPRSLWVCGENDTGKLGVEKKAKILTKINLNTFLHSQESISDISSSHHHSMLLTDKRRVFTCGCSIIGGALGHGDFEIYRKFTMVDLSMVLQGNESVIKISAGYYHSLLLTDKGQVLDCGQNPLKQIGLSEGKTYNKFTLVNLSSILQENEVVVDLSAGNDHSLLLTNKGRVITYGNNTPGRRLWLLDYKHRDVFSMLNLNNILPVNDSIITFKAGDYRCMLLTDSGLVLACGNNADGQLGFGDNVKRTKFDIVNLHEKLSNNEKVIDIKLGHFHTLLLTNHGRVFASGNNGSGQLGLEDNKELNTFTLVDLSSVLQHNELIVSISAGRLQSSFLTNQGQVIICGQGSGREALDANCNHKLFTKLDLSFINQEDEPSQNNCIIS